LCGGGGGVVGVRSFVAWSIKMALGSGGQPMYMYVYIILVYSSFLFLFFLLSYAS
jgi:hypothetical protein